MIQTSWKCLLTGVVVAIALSSSAPQVDAHCWGGCQPWGCCGGLRYAAPLYAPCCSSFYAPCYSSCYASCCGTWSPAVTTAVNAPCCYGGDYYLGVRPGPIRRLLSGHYRWYWGGDCWGGCATYSVPGCGCSGQAEPAQTPTPAPAPTPAQRNPMELNPTMAPPAPILKTTATPAEQSGVLTVWVPFDAKVTVNGQETRSTGSRRQLVSYDLKPGLSYRYVVKAQVVRDGQLVEDTKSVTMMAGDATAVAFGFNASPAEQVAAAR